MSGWFACSTAGPPWFSSICALQWLLTLVPTARLHFQKPCTILFVSGCCPMTMDVQLAHCHGRSLHFPTPVSAAWCILNSEFVSSRPQSSCSWPGEGQWDAQLGSATDWGYEFAARFEKDAGMLWGFSPVFFTLVTECGTEIWSKEVADVPAHSGVCAPTWLPG